MELPPRDTLLDIEWLEQTHAAYGMTVLGSLLRRGSEVYGGLVTAIADAALSPGCGVGRRLTDQSEVPYALAHHLLAGCWSPAHGGPGRYRVEHLFGFLTASFPRERRVQMWEKMRARGVDPPPDPALPNLSELRLPDAISWVSLAHTAGIWGCEISPDGSLVASVSRDGHVALWAMDSGLLVTRADTGEPNVRHCGFTPDGHLLITMHQGGSITIWRVSDLTPVALFAVPTGRWEWSHRWRRFAISQDSAWLAVGSGNTLHVWDLVQQRLVSTIMFESDRDVGAFALTFTSHRHLRVVAFGKPGSIATVDVVQQRVMATQSWSCAERYDIGRVTGDDRYLVAMQPNIDVWHLESRSLVASVPLEFAGRALALSADGTQAATYSFNPRGLRVWSLPTLQEIARCDLQGLGAWDISTAVAFTPDTRSVVAAGWDGVLRRVPLAGLLRAL